MKVLFLDIDGVLNSTQSVYYNMTQRIHNKLPIIEDVRPTEFFCPIAASNFQRILDEVPSLKIVISSTWRHFSDKRLQELFKVFDLPWAKVVGKTPARAKNNKGERGHEIQQWLDENPGVLDFVILDDSADMVHLSNHLHLTNSDHGLTWEVAESIINHFNR